MSAFNSNELDSIDPKFIVEFNDETFSPQHIEELCSNVYVNSNLRILRVLKCKSLDKFMVKIREQNFVAELSKTSHLFVISIETEHSVEDLTPEIFTSKSIFNDGRPLIIQIVPVSKTPIVYYKETNSDVIIKVYEAGTIIQDNSLHQSRTQNESNFPVFLDALNSKVYNFNGNLLDIKLNKNKIQEEIAVSTAIHNALVRRFLKLFKARDEDFDLPLSGDVFQNDDDHYLMTVLDLPFTALELEPELTNSQQKNLTGKDDRGYNILMMATERNHLKSLKLLLNCGLTLDFFGEEGKAAELAWDLNHHECLVELLKADSCFPVKFDIQKIPGDCPAYNAIAKIIAERSFFHNAIEEANEIEINKFIKNNPSLKYVYNTSNKSAVSIALGSKNFEVYSMLQAQGFAAGVDINFDIVFQKLNMEEKRALRESNKKFFNLFDNSHIVHILSKCRLGSYYQNRADCYAFIHSMLERLSEIPEILQILKVLEKTNKLQIIFDFNNLNVRYLEPTQGKTTEGSTSFGTGYLYIAAGNHKENFTVIMATLAHEMAHYAMQLMYENDCKPYEFRDKTKMEKFKDISEKLYIHWQGNKDTTDSIIGNVFSVYTEEHWHAEIIVRVPHLITFYSEQKDKLKDVRQGYCKELFQFYDSNTSDDIKNLSSIIKLRTEISELNQRLGFLSKIANHQFKINPYACINQTKTFAKSLEQSKVKMIDSHTPTLSLSLIYEYFREQFGKNLDKYIIFAHTSTFASDYESCKIKELCTSDAKPFLVVSCEKIFESGPEELIMPIFDKLILVSSCDSKLSAETEALKRNFEYKQINFKWKDLNPDSREKLNEKEIMFQGNKIKLKDVLYNNSSAFQYLPLEKAWNGQLIVNEPSLIKTNFIMQDFYIERKFLIHRSFENQKTIENSINQEKLLLRAAETKIVILSNVAGMGKSTTLFKIAGSLRQSLKSHWVSFVDLKQRLEEFKRIPEHDTSKIFPELISDFFLDFANSFDQKLFLELYDRGKAIILLDGFDEISPLYKEQIMSIVKTFDSKLDNQLWVTTRLHLQSDLEQGLNQLACELSPLTEKDQVEFLIKYWESEKVLSETRVTDREVAKKLIDKIYQSSLRSSTVLLSLPLQLRMVAEIYSDNLETFESLTFYTIYDKFIEKTFDIWRTEKGYLSKKDQHKFDQGQSNPRVVHQNLALRYLFQYEMIIFHEEDDDDEEEMTNEMISRIGIINIDKTTGNKQFIHETFAEYFAANFISYWAIQKNSRRNKPEKELVSRLLLNVLKSEKYQMVRNFLDEILQTLNQQTLLGISLNSFESDVEEKDCYGVFPFIIKEGLESLLDLVLLFVEKIIGNQDVKRRLTVFITENQENILMLACKQSNEILDKILNLLKKVLNLNEVQTFIEGIDCDGSNALHLAVETNEKTVIETLCGFITNNLDSFERKKNLFFKSRKNNFNIFHCAALNNKNEKIFSTLQLCLKEFLSQKKLKEILRQIESKNRNVLDVLIEEDNVKGIHQFKDIFNKVFTFEERRQYLSKKRGVLRNIIFVAVNKSSEKFLLILSQLLRENFTPKEFETFFMENDTSNANLLHLVAGNHKSSEMFSTLRTNFEDVLTKDVVKKMLRQINSYKRNTLHTMIRQQSEKALTEFLKMLDEVFDTEELKEYLTEKCDYGTNIITLAAQRTSKEFFENLFRYLLKIFSNDELSSLIYETDHSNLNILHLIAKDNHSNTGLFTVLRWSFPLCLSKEKFREMLNRKGKYKENVFHTLVKYKNENSLGDLTNILEEIFTFEELKQFLCEKDGFYGRNLISLAAHSSNTKFFDELCNFLMNVFDSNDFKALLLDNDKLGSSCLSIACQYNNKNMVQNISALVKKFLSIQELKDFFLRVNLEGNNIFHLAALNEKSNIFETLIHVLEESFNQNDIKNLLLHRNENKSYPMHYAVQHNNLTGMMILFIKSEKCLNLDEQRMIFQSCDKADNSICHLAGYRKNKEIFSTLISCLNGIFAESEILNLSKQKNRVGQNVLHVIRAMDNEARNVAALKDFSMVLEFKQNLSDRELQTRTNILCISARQTSKVFFKCLSLILTSIYDPIEVKALLLVLDKNGSYIIHHAVINNEISDIFTTLKTNYQDILNNEILNELLQLKNRDGFNVLELSIITENYPELHQCKYCFIEINKNEPNGFGKPNACTYNADFIQKICDFMTDDNLRSLIFQENITNTLHSEIERSDKAVVEKLSSIIKRVLNLDEQKIIFQNSDKDDNNINDLEYNKNKEKFITLESFLERFFFEKEIKKILFRDDAYAAE